MFNQVKRSNSSNETRQLKDWIREFTAIPEDFAILVTELKCTEPGCPPLETVIALLGLGAAKYQQKIHLPINQISEAEAKSLSAKLQRQLSGTNEGEDHEH